MKKFQSFALLLAGAFVIALPVMASAKSSDEKATGTVNATQGSTTAQISLTVSGGFSMSMMSSDLQHGTYTYRDDSGLAYSVDVRFAKFTDNAVWFSGPVVTSTDASKINTWLVVNAYDNDQSAGTSDLINSRFVTSPLAAFNMTVFLNQYMDEHYEVTGGNIKVH